MTPAAQLQATIEQLEQIFAEARPADTIISAYFRNRRFIGSKDRNIIAQTTYRVLRHREKLLWWLERFSAETDGRNLLLVDLLLAEAWTAKKIESHFTGERYAPEILTRNEYGWLNNLQSKELIAPDMPPAVKYECPPNWLPYFEVSLGKQLWTELEALCHYAPLDLRVNTLKSNRAKLLGQLQGMGMRAEATTYSPWGIRMQGRPAVQASSEFQNGMMEIQDEGSQLIGLLCDAQPGMQVMDFCAGAGGKTLALAATMQNKGRLVASDVLEKRLIRAQERFKRAGAGNITTRPLTSANDKWVKRNVGLFDRVLVDAPCSGTGVWRRNPDARWQQLGPGIEQLLIEQATILRSAARLVKLGGRLIYATCSLLQIENQIQVQNFLADHPQFKLLPMVEIWQALQTDNPDLSAAAPVGNTDYLAMSPAQHQTDGFFAAIMVRE